MSVVKRYKLERKSIPVILEDEKTGQDLAYALHEMDGTERDKYTTVVTERMKPDADGKPTDFSNMEGLEADLLAASFYEAELDMKTELVAGELVDVATVIRIGQPATLEFIQSLPASVREDLHGQAQKLSAIGAGDEGDEGDEGSAKNE